MVSSLEITQEDLEAIYRIKYYQNGKPDWSPVLRHSLGYFTPDDHYEALVAHLVTAGCRWADVGCGRAIFPSNLPLAEKLSQQANFVLGIDPDDNVKENPSLNASFQGFIEDYPENDQFDLITLRMVAEHIVDPEKAVSRLSELTVSGGHVVIYTPYKWTPMSIAATLTPDLLHNTFKRLIWDSEERDTFPVCKKMNTRSALNGYFIPTGFRESFFTRINDCTITTAFRHLNYLEIRLQAIFSLFGLNYPENNILAAYTRS